MPTLKCDLRDVKGVFPQQAFWLEMVSKQVLLNADLLLMLVTKLVTKMAAELASQLTQLVDKSGKLFFASVCGLYK